jgi:hypothetical protein
VTALFTSTGISGKTDPVRLLVLLWGKRFIIIAVAILFSILGTIFMLSRPLSAEIRTVVEVGYTAGGLVETIDVVRQKINDIYSVAAEDEIRAASPDNSNISLNVRPRIARNSNIIVLESSAPLGQVDLYRSYHAKIFEYIARDHNRTFEPLRAGLETTREEQRAVLKKLEERATVDPLKSQLLAQLEELRGQERALRDERIFGVAVKTLEGQVSDAEKALKDLQDEERLLAQTRAQTDVSVKNYADQIERLKQFLNDARAQRSKLASSPNDSNNAIAALIFDAENLRTEIELQKLERALVVDAPLDQEKAEAELLKNRRQQPIQEQAIARSKAEIPKLTLEREQKLAVARVAIDNILAKLGETETSRLHEIAVQKAKLQETDIRLGNILVTRVVVPPRRNQEGEHSRMFFAGLALLAGLGLGLLAGVFAVFKDAMTSRSAQRV